MTNRFLRLSHEIGVLSYQPIMSGLALVKKLREIGRTDFIGQDFSWM